MKHVVFLVNPNAGQANADRLKSAARGCRDDGGPAYTIIPRDKDGAGNAKLAEFIDNGPVRVVAVGGDGTVSFAADRIHGRDAELGIVPQGTANLLARELGIPLDTGAAVRLAMTGRKIRPVDAMDIDNRWYLSHVSMGTYSRVAASQSRLAKAVLGRFAYVVSIANELRHRKSWRFELDIDGARLETEASLVLAANIAAMGIGSMSWGDHIDPGDGHFDLVIVKAVTLPQYLRLIQCVRSGRRPPQDLLQYNRFTKDLKINTRSDLPVRADGNPIGSRGLHLIVRPGALNVVTG